CAGNGSEVIGTFCRSITFYLQNLEGEAVAWSFHSDVIVTVKFGDPPEATFFDDNYKPHLAFPRNGSALTFSQLRMEDAGTYTAKSSGVKSTFTLHIYRELSVPTVTCMVQNCSAGICRYILWCTTSAGTYSIRKAAIVTAAVAGAGVLLAAVILVIYCKPKSCRIFHLTADKAVNTALVIKEDSGHQSPTERDDGLELLTDPNTTPGDMDKLTTWPTASPTPLWSRDPIITTVLTQRDAAGNKTRNASAVPIKYWSPAIFVVVALLVLFFTYRWTKGEGSWDRATSTGDSSDLGALDHTSTPKTAAPQEERKGPEKPPALEHNETTFSEPDPTPDLQ
ncbi:PREDICTED: uncharacterized protein LOC104404708, partial [Nestor notabilis]|uniref:uncharacterized protein LOC104404708 n=1 Tax=Nestor notabilis TaxID=176057 RepID=UPI000523678B